MKDGQKITYYGEGDQEPGLEPGDVIIVLDQNEHTVFQRQHDNLFMKMEIKLVEALCGFKRTITTLDNRALMISSPPGKHHMPFTLNLKLNFSCAYLAVSYIILLELIIITQEIYKRKINTTPLYCRKSRETQWHKMHPKWRHAYLQRSLCEGPVNHPVHCKFAFSDNLGFLFVFLVLWRNILVHVSSCSWKVIVNLIWTVYV